MSGKVFGDGTKSIQHVIARQNKTMNMCENYQKPTQKSPEQVLVGALG